MRPSSIIAVCLMLIIVAACTPEPAKPEPASQLPSAAPAPANQPTAPMSQAPPAVVETPPAPEPIDFTDTLSQSIADFEFDIKVT